MAKRYFLILCAIFFFLIHVSHALADTPDASGKFTYSQDPARISANMSPGHYTITVKANNPADLIDGKWYHFYASPAIKANDLANSAAGVLGGTTVTRSVADVVAQPKTNADGTKQITFQISFSSILGATVTNDPGTWSFVVFLGSQGINGIGAGKTDGADTVKKNTITGGSYLIYPPGCADAGVPAILLEGSTFQANSTTNAHILNPCANTNYTIWFDGNKDNEPIWTQKFSDSDIVDGKDANNQPTKEVVKSFNVGEAGKKTVCLTIANAIFNNVAGLSCTYKTPEITVTNLSVSGTPTPVQSNQTGNNVTKDDLKPIDLNPTVPPPNPPPCVANSFDATGNCAKFDSAIGVIDTNPADFINKLFRILLGLSGGIAVILIIYSGFRLSTARGDEKAVQGARETINAAIIGLLFLIFSFVILEVLGVDILHIPGFSATEGSTSITIPRPTPCPPGTGAVAGICT